MKLARRTFLHLAAGATALPAVYAEKWWPRVKEFGIKAE
jgi:hypothetical protein